MSKAKPLKKRLAALEAEIEACSDASQRGELRQKADQLRRDLELAGYLSPLVKQPKPKKTKRPAKKNKPQQVDPLVRAKNSPGFAGVPIRFVQGGSMRKK